MIESRPGVVLGERYRLRECLGAGGMGSVWAADDTKLERPVAVKLMAEDLADDPKVIQRFEREAMAVAKLTSPHIVEIHDYGLQQDTPYMVMEFLEGYDLRHYLTGHQRLSLPVLASILGQVTKALTVAHQAGIIHRDLKPANVFLARQEGGKVVKVFDFGIAKALTNPISATDLTTAGTLLGSPYYMSPEQILAEGPVDQRTDQWSLGVIAYEALTGQLPFEAQSLSALFSNICLSDYTPVCELLPELPADIDGLFARVLAKSLDERYDSVQEFAAELDRCVALMAPLSPSSAAQHTSQDELSVDEQAHDSSPSIPGSIGDSTGSPGEATNAVAREALGDHHGTLDAATRIASGDETTSSLRRRWLPIALAAGIVLFLVGGVNLMSRAPAGSEVQPSASAPRGGPSAKAAANPVNSSLDTALPTDPVPTTKAIGGGRADPKAVLDAGLEPSPPSSGRAATASGRPSTTASSEPLTTSRPPATAAPSKPGNSPTAKSTELFDQPW